MEEKRNLTPAEKGVHRRRMGIIMLIFALLYGTYALVFDKTMDGIFISSIIITGGALLGIGKVVKGSSE